jgi:hypothetical protein
LRRRFPARVVRSTCIAGLALGFVLLCQIPAPATGKKHSSPKAPASPTAVDRDYIAALVTANRFLNARQSHDQETGILLLTDGVKTHISEEYLSTFFSSDAQTTYEIARGKKLAFGRYSFPVTLFEVTSAPARNWTHPRSSQIVVTKTGRDDWAIDKLP